MERSFPVILSPQPEDGYFIECPALPGCYSQGETEREAMENIREAIELVREDVAKTPYRPGSEDGHDARDPA